MSELQLDYPIKLNIYNKQEIVQQYIFIGDVDKNVREKLEKLETSQYDEKQIMKIIGGEEITLQDLENLGKPVVEQKKKVNKSKFVFDVELYKNDTIIQFKRKISTVTNIPIYKQNIWYQYKENKYNLNYNVFLNGKISNQSLVDNIVQDVSIENIPISMNYYDFKDNLQITTDDPFSTIEQFTNDLNIYEFNLFNLDDFINVDQMYSLYSNPRQANQIEIIYYGFVVIYWPIFTYSVWIDYIKQQSDFERIYPDIALNQQKQSQIFKNERDITNDAIQYYNSDPKKDLQKLYLSITYSMVSIENLTSQKIIDIRNLFDLFEVTPEIYAIRACPVYKEKIIILDKTYKNYPPLNSKIISNSIIFRVKVEDMYSDLYIFDNGNYSIYSRWAEDKFYDFDKIVKILMEIINPFIAKINKLGSKAIKSNYFIPKISKFNINISTVHMVIIYRDNIKYQQFKQMANLLDDYAQAGIIKVKSIDFNSNILEYYFTKGIHQFTSSRIEKSLNLENYYSYLTNQSVKQRWQQIFENVRNTRIQYQQGIVKIQIDGLKQKEFFGFYIYIVYLFGQIKKSQTKGPQVIQRSIKTLKSQDPVLYNFKKIYNQGVNYSKICQKKFQPVILNNEDYQNLPKQDKQKVVQFWNFTTKMPAYYYCPNKRYSHLGFKIKQHPKDFCLPCCRVKPTEDDKALKQIYNICLNEHAYTEAKVNITEDTRYIMNYGKSIQPGRLSKLPGNMVALFSSTSMEENKLSEKDQMTNYFIVGVPQHYNQTKYIGAVSALAFCLEMPIEKFISNTIDLIKQNKDSFSYISDTSNFMDVNDFIDKMAQLNEDTLNTQTYSWNNIFIDVAYYFYDINCIIFEDNNKDVNLIINNRIDNSAKIKNPNQQSLLLIKNKQLYNPIFKMNQNLYFKTNLIPKKLFDNKDLVLDIIDELVKFSKQQKISQNIQFDIDVDAYTEFVKYLNSDKKYAGFKINKYYVNKDNLLYCIEISNKKMVFKLPVKYSDYIYDETIEVISEPAKFINCNKFNDLNWLIKNINHWIAVNSQPLENPDKTKPLEQRVAPKYKYISVDKWIYLDNPYSNSKSMIIGFINNDLNFYHQPLDVQKALKLKKAPLERLLYHPDEINKNIVQEPAGIPTADLYEFYSYELFIIQMVNYINSQRNNSLRLKIEQIMSSTVDFNKIESEVEKYYSRLNLPIEQQKDIEQLNTLVNNYYSKSKDKKHLIQQFQQQFFSFDKILVNEIQLKTDEELHSQFQKISEKIFTNNIGQKQISMNYLDDCSTNAEFCVGNKMIMNKKNILPYIKLFTADVRNKFKSKYIFDVVIQSAVEYFKFIKRPNEKIKIQTQLV